MNHVLQQLSEAVSRHQPVAFTALAETRGSTPQKAGATMLVFPDGSQVGTLGGGCVEAEVKRRALRLLDEGETELLTFNLDSDYGWDDGLICGGRMKMLIDPVRSEKDFAYYRQVMDLIAADTGCTEAIVLDTDKGAGQPGDRYLINDKAEVVVATGPSFRAASSVAIAQLLGTVQQNLRPLPQRPRPYVAGGVSFLPHLRRCRLLIVGAGHVGQRVAELAAACDFDVWVVDDREQYCNSDRFPQAKRLIVGDIDGALSGLDVDHNTYCLIVTRGHHHDEQALYHLAETPARYVGMIGSHRKIKMIFEDLLREGISREAIARVNAPLGFDIGSQTVPEIAVSIVAELIAHRNLGEIPERYRRASLLEEIAAV
ncbi:MAG: XdhC family protein [Planctomycetia bacterium]|nr:XdhC family protein [Planctomycetia bacterium]